MVDIKIPRPDFEKDRGQIGVETLVVFIAMILVAALAAGVLINTAGFLQNKASSTSEDSQQQVSNQVRVIGAVGHVDADDSADTDNNITSINLSVMQAPGADSIDLEGATVRYISPNGATTLVYDDVANATGGNFSVTGVKDTDGSVPVLNSQEDRFEINIELLSESELNNTDTEAAEALGALEPGSDATLRVVTASGAQSTFIANVPQSLSSSEDGEAVSL